jgi:PTH1 family peptidyl-tRNA hydrolase
LSDLFVIAGLGNPGSKFAETRHNAGFWFLDEVARRHNVSFRLQKKMLSETARLTIDGQDCLLVKPDTFMNHSGQAIRAVTGYYQVDTSNLMVAYDELDLPAGVVRLKQGGGHGGHNGMRDIFRHLSERDFLRLRIGIGHPGTKDAVTNYVLGRPGAVDERLIRENIGAALDVLPDVLSGFVPQAMKTLHTTESNT